MEELYREGRIRAIGVCNFYPDRLTDLCANASVIPSVDQVELHPFFQQAGALQAMRELGVQPQAWGPLAEGTHGIKIRQNCGPSGAALERTAWCIHYS